MPSEYELNAIKEIKEWKQGRNSNWQKAKKVALWPFEATSSFIQRMPGVEWVIAGVFIGVLRLIGDVAQLSVRSDAILKKYKRKNDNINELSDIIILDLKDIDRNLSGLSVKYALSAAGSGLANGLIGPLGIVTDLISLFGLNFRAVGEYAAYCGFDVKKDQGERLFVMGVLGLASSPNSAAKAAAMAQINLITQQLAKKAGWAELEKHMIVQLIQKIARSLGIRLTKGKLAQVIPVVGGLIGSGFNAYLMYNVCDAAYYLYRERFLIEKYGSSVMSCVDVSNECSDAWSDGDEPFLDGIDEATDIGEPPPGL